tara:strand:- start:382 stop:1242 length:861 start_codon:yes stop_codon:yes gene_type:complete
MSDLLDDDAQSELTTMMNEAWEAEDSADVSMEAEDSSDGAEDVKREAQGDGEAATGERGDSSPSSSAAESATGQPSKAQQGPPDMIPYARFRQENQKYREMHTRNADLQKKLSAMEHQVSEAQTASPPREVESDPFDSIFGESVPPAQEGPSPEFQKLQSRFDQFEDNIKLVESEKALDASMESIKAEYPDVPDDVLYQAVIDHKSLDAMKVYADRYRGMVSHYKKLGVQEAQASAKSGRRRAGSPPRVPRSANEGATVDTGEAMTRDGAREGMESLLRKSGFFDS